MPRPASGSSTRSSSAGATRGPCSTRSSDAVRVRLTAGASADPAATAALAAVARRLVAIDPDRAGIGGLRLQLELALFAGATAAPRIPATVAPTRAAVAG